MTSLLPPSISIPCSSLHRLRCSSSSWRPIPLRLLSLLSPRLLLSSRRPGTSNLTFRSSRSFCRSSQSARHTPPPPPTAPQTSSRELLRCSPWRLFSSPADSPAPALQFPLLRPEPPAPVECPAPFATADCDALRGAATGIPRVDSKWRSTLVSLATAAPRGDIGGCIVAVTAATAPLCGSQ